MLSLVFKSGAQRSSRSAQAASYLNVALKWAEFSDLHHLYYTIRVRDAL